MTGYRTRSMMCHPILSPVVSSSFLWTGSPQLSGRSSPETAAAAGTSSLTTGANCKPEVIGVAQVINKTTGSTTGKSIQPFLNWKMTFKYFFSGNGGGGFSVHDDAVFSKYLQFCGIGLRNAQLYERSQLEVRRNQVLLDLAGVIFQASLTKLVHTCITCLQLRFLKPRGSIIYLSR